MNVDPYKLPRLPDPGLFELGAYNISASPGFGDWLAEQGTSIAVSDGAQLIMVGRDGNGGLRAETRGFQGIGAVAAGGPGTLYVTTSWQLVRMQNALLEGRLDAEGRDAVYLPQKGWTIGAVGVYDLAASPGGAPFFTSALCNCIATVSSRLNFTAVWKPPFISELGGGDRCHLTGLALDGGELAYAVCASESDEVDGWREAPAGAGVVVDAREHRVLARGLSLPHTPRLYEGELYVAGGGDAGLLRIGREDGRVEVVARVPGFARGLDFVGSFALVGCSTLHGDEVLKEIARPTMKESEQRQAVAVVDMKSGEVAHELSFAGASGEIFAVTAVHDCLYAAFVDSPGRVVERLSLGPVEPLRGRGGHEFVT
jgi:uncharacterized protein (TIGR03032 family)